MKNKLMLGVSITIWCVAILISNVFLFNFEKTAGQQLSAPSKWPAASALKLKSPHPTLVMFVHPRCPCVRASLWELEKIMTQFEGKLRAYIVLLVPNGLSIDWAKTDIYKESKQIPGVDVFFDVGGVETSRFHALTTGFTTLYGADGFLIFDGGITVGRGHLGANPGERAIKNQLEGKNLFLVNQFSVFGCPLVTPENMRHLVK